MIMFNRIELSDFCSLPSECLRHDLSKPFINQYRAVATDAAILVRLNGICGLPPNDPKRELPGNISGQFPVGNGVEVQLPEIQKPRNVGRNWRSDLSDFGYGATELHPDALVLHKLGGLEFRSMYLWMISQLDEPRAYVHKSRSLMRFTFIGGDGVLLPVVSSVAEFNSQEAGARK